MAAINVHVAPTTPEPSEESATEVSDSSVPECMPSQYSPSSVESAVSESELVQRSSIQIY